MKRPKPDFICPVCGLGAYISENKESRGQWRVRCWWCELKTDWFSSKEEAVEAWKKVEKYWTERDIKKSSQST